MNRYFGRDIYIKTNFHSKKKGKKLEKSYILMCHSLDLSNSLEIFFATFQKASLAKNVLIRNM